MSLPELLILLSVIPSFLFLCIVIPPIQVMFVLMWIFCLTFDVHSTYSFYIKDPTNFEKNERNKLYSALTKKYGFKKAALIFPTTIELPLLLFLSIIPLQISCSYMFPSMPNNFIGCLTASFGIAAIGHLQAATKNNKHNNNKPHPNSFNP